MKKLLIIPAVFAITSLSGAAFATDHHSGATWTNAFNTSNTSTLNQSIGYVGGYHSTATNNAEVQQFGAAVTGGRSCVCKNNLYNAFNTSNSSSVNQSIGSVKWGGTATNNASVFQAGASFGSTAP